MLPHVNETKEYFLGHLGKPCHEIDSTVAGLIGRRVSQGKSYYTEIPLIGILVEADVKDFIAEVKISQCYRNTANEPIEATYNFPVDQAAAVCGFEAHYEDGSIVKGVVKEKGEAKQEYTLAICQGQQANILENVKRDIFTLRVGNLLPGESLKIVLTYVTTLKAQGDVASFVLPTTIAPRYSPASSSVLSSEEAEAVAPPTTNVKLFGLTIRIKVDCRSEIKRISSPTHPECLLSCKIEGKSGNVAVKNIPMDRELILLVEEERAHQPRACVEISDDGSVAGLVTIFPQVEFEDLRREIIFVLDRSGSMDWTRTATGKSQIEQAREALLIFLRSLPPTCTFNIVSFGSTYKSLFRTPMPYDDKTLELATTHVMKMEADLGGTEIEPPLKAVLEQDLAAEMERQVFVLTDGQVSNDLEVFETIRRGCSDKSGNKWWSGGKTGRCRVFSLGIGAGVSCHLVEGIAKAGGGTARFIEGDDSKLLSQTIMEQLKQALQPALDEVSITWNMPESMKPAERLMDENDVPDQPTATTLLGYRSPSLESRAHGSTPHVFPSIIPPVFSRERFLSFALFPSGSTDIPDSVTIRCNTPDGPLEETIVITDEEVFHGSVAHKMAARAAISEYEDRRSDRLPRSFPIGRSSSGVLSDREALQLALDNSLASDATSFVAVLEKPVVKAGRVPMKKSIPQCLSVSGIPPTPPAQGGHAANGVLLPHLSPPHGVASEAHSAASPAVLPVGRERWEASVEANENLAELTGMFEKLAHLVAEQGESLEKIKEDLVGSASRSIGVSELVTLHNMNSAGRRLRRIFDGAVDICKIIISNALLQRVIIVLFLLVMWDVFVLLVIWDRVDAILAFEPLTMLVAVAGCELHYYVLTHSWPVKETASTASRMEPACKSGTSATRTRQPGESASTRSDGVPPLNRSHQKLVPMHKSGTFAAPPKRPGIPAKSDDMLLNLSLLQKADGSFALDDRLARVAGPSPGETKCMAAKALGKSSAVLDDVQLATVLAVATLRKKFPKERVIWELQECKALDYLGSRGRAPYVAEYFVDSLAKELVVTSKLD